MSRADRPSALLRRIRGVSPLVRVALVAAVGVGLVSTAALIVQAVTLAAMLSALFHSARASLTPDLWYFLGASAVRALALGCAEPLTARIARPIRRELRRRAMRLVLRRGPFETVDATVQLCTRGIDAIEQYVAKYVPALVLSALAPTLLLVWFAATDWWSAVIVTVSVALLPLFMVLLGLEARGKMQQRWIEQQRLAGYFGDVVRGMTVLKSFNRSNDAVDNLNEVGVALRRSTMDTLRVAFLSSFALELLSSLATAIVALVLGLRLLNGSLGLNVALAVLLLTPEVYLPLRRAAAQFHSSSDGIAAAADLLDYLDHAPVEGNVAAPERPPTIALRDVALTGANRRTDERTLSATMAAGGLTVITGPSGSGKSTLLRYIAGLRTPGRGQVLVDDVDLAEMSLDDWQSRVGWLPQDPTLPGTSVREAVAMWRAVDDATILRALARVGLDLDLDRPLGEGASELSAGQRRRLALVRCIVRDPLVLLLDEPMAHLDDTSAAQVAEVIAGLDMTRVVATHRHLDADQTIDIAGRTHDVR